MWLSESLSLFPSSSSLSPPPPPLFILRPFYCFLTILSHSHLSVSGTLFLASTLKVSLPPLSISFSLPFSYRLSILYKAPNHSSTKIALLLCTFTAVHISYDLNCTTITTTTATKPQNKTKQKRKSKTKGKIPLYFSFFFTISSLPLPLPHPKPWKQHQKLVTENNISKQSNHPRTNSLEQKVISLLLLLDLGPTGLSSF